MSKLSISQSHSSGEWEVFDGRDLWACNGALHYRIAHFEQRGEPVERTDSPDIDYPETAANIALCAAAPDMLAALVAVQEWLRRIDFTLDSVNDAIAKARGQAS